MKVKPFYKNVFILIIYFSISLILFFFYKKMQSSIVENYCSRMIIRINDEKNAQKNTGVDGGADGSIYGSGYDTIIDESGYVYGDGTLGNVNGSGDITSTETISDPLNYCPVSVTRDRWNYSLTYVDGRGVKSRSYPDVDTYTTAVVKLQKDRGIDCPEVYIV